METTHLKLIVAHPGKQHSYQMAGALEQAGYLSKYVTTVYDSDNSILMRIVKRLIGGQDRRRANSRSTNLIPQNKVKQFCEFRGLLVLAILRIDKKRRIYNWYSDHVARKFGKKVAMLAIKENADAIICYDTSAKYCFEILKEKAPHITRVLDNAAMNRYGLFMLYQEMNRKYGILRDKTGFKSYLLNEKECHKYKEEAYLADYHIVASSFSKSTLTIIGIDETRIALIPYGVDSDGIPQKTYYSKDGKLKILYAGEVSPQKGIYNLIEMARIFRNEVEFHVVGSGMEKLTLEIQNEINENMVVHGYLLQEDLFKLYSDCDVFVFPSLGDGFGFVVIEAMLAGLPVICSTNSVGADAIIDGNNGFVFDAGDSKALKERIDYFLANRSQIEIMGRNAIQQAKSFSWDNYGRKIDAFVREL
ncbi:MAG: glycosyltransferase family 4 protein [Clostridia bacterium]|nr:glycosyltransferase family 4 protein [Clostridia bacterium]